MNVDTLEVEKFRNLEKEYELVLGRYKHKNIAVLAGFNKNSISPRAELVIEDQNKFKSNVLRLDRVISS